MVSEWPIRDTTAATREVMTGASATERAHPMTADTQSDLLTPREVADAFRVDPKTVTRWAKAGKLTAVRTLGGHRRYKREEIETLLRNSAKQ